MTRDDRDDLLQCIGECILGAATIFVPLVAFFGAFALTVLQLVTMIFEAGAA